MTLNQLQLIKIIIELLGAKDANPKANLVVEPLLNKNADEKERNEDSFHHRSTIVCAPCLEGCTRPDASMAFHKADKFSNYQNEYHDASVKLIKKYLLGMSEEGLMHMPDVSKVLEVFSDVDFAGGFDNLCPEDPASVCCRIGFFIKCSG